MLKNPTLQGTIMGLKIVFTGAVLILMLSGFIDIFTSSRPHTGGDEELASGIVLCPLLVLLLLIWLPNIVRHLPLQKADTKAKGTEKNRQHNR